LSGIERKRRRAMSNANRICPRSTSARFRAITRQRNGQTGADIQYPILTIITIVILFAQ